MMSRDLGSMLYSPNLVVQCRDNLLKYREKTGSQANLEVLEADATKYVPPSDATVFYFFNPFQQPLLEQAIEGIRQSVREAPRMVYLMFFQIYYFEPPSLDLIDEITGVKTFSNLLDPQKFMDASR